MKKGCKKRKCWRDTKPPEVLDASATMRKEPVEYNTPLMKAKCRTYCSCNQNNPLSSFDDYDKSFRRGNTFSAPQIADAKEQLLREILRKMNVPSIEKLKGKYFGRFRKWCKKHNIDPDKQTANGKVFRRYVKELETNFNKRKKRAEKVKGLFRVVGQMWTSAEAVQEDEEKNGWNMCLFDYIRIGKAPDKKDPSGGSMYDRARAIGHNEAREELLAISKDVRH